MPGLVMLWGLAAEAVGAMLLWLSERKGDTLLTDGPVIFGAIIFHTLSSFFFAQGLWQMLPRRTSCPSREAGFPVFGHMDFAGTGRARRTVERDGGAGTPSHPVAAGHTDCRLA